MNCLGRHDGEPEPAIDGEHLCRGCKRKLRYGLADIVELWPLLAVMLQPGGGAGGRTKPGSRPACDLGVADIRDPRGTVTGQLRSWARVVIEDRRLAPRTLSAPQAAQLLDVHLDWLCAQPFVDEAAAELHDCAWQIRKVCGDLPDPPIGTCPDIDPRGETDVCGGPLRWIDGSTSVVCARCGSSWAEADLPLFLRVVAPARKFPVPREWVVARYEVNPGQLRMWINRGHVRSYSDHQVELFDVLARIQEG